MNLHWSYINEMNLDKLILFKIYWLEIECKCKHTILEYIRDGELMTRSPLLVNETIIILVWRWLRLYFKLHWAYTKYKKLDELILFKFDWLETKDFNWYLLNSNLVTYRFKILSNKSKIWKLSKTKDYY